MMDVYGPTTDLVIALTALFVVSTALLMVAIACIDELQDELKRERSNARLREIQLTQVATGGDAAREVIRAIDDSRRTGRPLS